MNRALPCIRVAVALSAIAVAVCGCAAANNATSSQASAQGEQPYKTMYGLSSEGTTTDLYTEFFGPSQAPAPATSVAAAQPVQSVATQSVTAQPIAPVQPGTAATHSGQTTAATSPSRTNQSQTAAYRTQQPPAAQPAPVQVAQQPAPPSPPPEPDVPTVYGITANGPTTDLYTALFGPRRNDGQ